MDHILDPCSSGKDNCSINAACIPKRNADKTLTPLYNCHCDEGFYGDGYNCVPGNWQVFDSNLLTVQFSIIFQTHAFMALLIVINMPLAFQTTMEVIIVNAIKIIT